jgi:hypothetical protein
MPRLLRLFNAMGFMSKTVAELFSCCYVRAIVTAKPLRGEENVLSRHRNNDFEEFSHHFAGDSATECSKELV